MKNSNKIALIGGAVFAIFDAICALFAAFALEPFMAFWSYIAHVKFTGVEAESSVTIGSFFGGAVFFFIVGYLVTWLFVWLHQKFCCETK
ncbi:MAG: hypothetical protein A2667_01305 [Candidatus Wildermuthbacteria bacterium RIFCSPHIGHO2_01_FULL_47_27]|uniref:Uncharacterized protein n=1 Tax=Candidatus Wildermuthbacteria bacterium RIFCSPHIGHO2_02_FULL_47_17 TaxID=1802452 RepID=A0A1G2R483_9BACT|nr:MAG: hypothetical protein A2667_01305 [Candidatus Wildermuthbacteria bacterium RIFCSPHIGHO2_01_FULL_47_27]OHA67378.1 MAG: hypothetical protein A3D59_01270 [Candidatus Wildermuthbacteria bacterium RIFCSPHIGHO2_02_FULL_47_17]OHA76129.1 MAG: hypothetical protein A3I38_02745 [Candidatus Wildermuthbacteria bacterium RIFCSPLOWO2_02_FULL_47_10]